LGFVEKICLVSTFAINNFFRRKSFFHRFFFCTLFGTFLEYMIQGKFVFHFSEGNAEMRDLLGGKGANLSEMVSLGIPVPPGFIVSTDACIQFYETSETLSESLQREIFTALKNLEENTGKTFGYGENPLLVSVRSGARISMPGMMDTILNLGLNLETVESLSKKTNNPRFAWDSFRRFLHMFGNVVLEIPHEIFEHYLRDEKKRIGKTRDTDITAEEWKNIAIKFLSLIKEQTGKEFPMDPREQLLSAVKSVFASWNSERASFYRKIHHIPDNFGTAVIIQSMVFGNLGETSGTGVAFTRDPSTGENVFYGEFLMNAQGEDVVAGIRTPHPIEELEKTMPSAYQELISIRKILEEHFCEMQDIEFTIEESVLFILQTRTGKRSAESTIKIAVDMVHEKLISKHEALKRVKESSVEALLHPRLDIKEKSSMTPITKGLCASPGGASGSIVFSAEEAVRAAKLEKKVILVRQETSPEDIAGMHAAEGILTACGGMTSHAAVVARGMGKPCVSGASALEIDDKQKILRINALELKEGDIITIDGSTGEVFDGKIKKTPPNLSEEFQEFLSWADEVRTLKVFTNADTPKDALRARSFGAEGIGLCRTEHMFFEKDRICEIRRLILSEDIESRKEPLERILQFQQKDFEEIFEAMDGLPVTIRFLDPPLHEFLPQEDFEIQELGETTNKTPQEIRDRIKSLSEINPMLGHRGCRLMITIPELLDVQVEAILSAGLSRKKNGGNPIIHIMIPLVSHINEFLYLKRRIEEVMRIFLEKNNADLTIQIGTMIETPRACVISEEIAKYADFFSFGTNDLTQMTFGFSRDDIGKFLPSYISSEILKTDPFQHFDTEGVGWLLTLAVEKAKITKIGQDFKTSVCGEHGGDPESIYFFQKAGIDVISCSPFRLPVARFAAAKAALLHS
jgi:pyruvate, orthophosphate dikinase